MSPRKSSNVRTIEKTSDILDFPGKGKQGYSLREISGSLKIPKPTTTIHRMLSTLCGLGYTIQDPVSKDYRLGFRLVELGQAVLDRIDLRREAEPMLRQLADRVQLKSEVREAAAKISTRLGCDKPTLSERG